MPFYELISFINFSIMLSNIIRFGLNNKFIVLLGTAFLVGYGLFALSQISIGAVPDVTNNQVQVITTSTNLSTQDMEQFITYPVELEMANLPGVTEIRSVSKFGLSVVTIVFEDAMGTFLPRQLIAEKIKSAAEKIPKGFGSPQLGPITTGLGEIYQYLLDVKPEFKNQYSPQDLRTIQDWIVKRQLSGIPGVVEVNTWGGFLKQYEVAIDTKKLLAMNITATEVFDALENNNSVSGGGYIEKVNQAYFIRGEGLVQSLEDIKNIVVRNNQGIPIYIKDVAAVGFGNAMRFGAITGNGQGEKVMGQVMMLKDANSKRVIEAVKERVAAIAQSLPQGVYIHPFLDRSELIGRTTFTVVENLILAFLIVIFVVVLLLGNIRSGMVIASVIPLCLLFALSLMYVFGVDANLMSLGAIDFGIIIDGAVIIVEYIAYQLTQRQDLWATQLEPSHVSASTLSRLQLKDNIVFEGASKMMNSAVFGQLIILIVFIPILSLSGVEGKMFKPMALTFSFALIGAMILCFTYVPVMSALFLKPSTSDKNNFSNRLIRFFNSLYDPVMDWALGRKKLIIGVSVVILTFSVFLFTRMGGEFVPTLDEGDFVIQPVLKTGTSLSNTVAITTDIEKILIQNFPEVKQVVTRIGAAEVPTDPMSMEESDVIIQLKPKSEWVSAQTKDELADKFKEALAIIPGMEVEFTQPIEMRFNELITGVRADIAIKVFGEDLTVLAHLAQEIKSIVDTIEGAADVTVEKIEGLPQMNVRYNRSKIARYGLNISALNQMVAMGFAGRTVGSVFEGEKRFDLVVRLSQDNRLDLSNLKNLYVDLPMGGKIPLSELAEITYQKGAAKIARDDTKRRVVVGINVRNRDLQSVVDDVQSVITANLKLPVGYTITYGGQFQNLQSAKSRLQVAVPIALVLIFVLLFFAFKSVKEALLIYSAIPLAAVGGILLLWLRDMPFSISAGVGFIALFGIAVLNGIVLIEHFKILRQQNVYPIEALVKAGAKDRMRAVLLTASAAALGFLPMAVSTGAGAEVQRPLATVVIGGLISSTVLTLLVLPVLYAIFYNGLSSTIKLPSLTLKRGILPLLLLTSLAGLSQQPPKTLDELYTIASSNNAALEAYRIYQKEKRAMIETAFDFDATQVYFGYDQNNVAINGLPINVLGISQDFQFPTKYFSSKKVKKAQYLLAERTLELEQLKVKKGLTLAFYNYQIAKEKERLFKKLDSLYGRFAYAAQRKFELGETNYLEKITASAKRKKITLDWEQAVAEVHNAYLEIQQWVQSKDSLNVAVIPIAKLEGASLEVNTHPLISYFETQELVKQREIQFEKSALLPDITAEYFQGSNEGLNSNLIGYQLGLKIPLFFSAQVARIKAARLAKQRAEQETQQQWQVLKTEYQKLVQQLKEQQRALVYYENEGTALSDEILKTASSSFKNGEIDFFQYLQSLENAYELKLSHLEQLKKHNQTVINLKYLTL